MNIIYN